MVDSLPGLLGFAVGVGGLSWLSVGWLRRYALAHQILDYPRERTSHVVPTPRGGGAGVLLAALAGYLFVLRPSGVDWPTMVALLAVAPAAVSGWLDDRDSLPVLPRFLAHVMSGLLIVPLAVGGTPSVLMPIIAIGWVAATVSAINVVNFMDGVDGFIGLQAAIFGAHLTIVGGIDSSGGLLGICLAAASAGFLIWNWSPARVFLGDVGSGTLAVLGVIGGVLVWQQNGVRFTSVFLPLVPIFLDSAVTIVRRTWRGERLTLAHRSHLYQRLANECGWGHARVSIAFGAAAAAGSTLVVIVPHDWEVIACGAYVVSVLGIGVTFERTVIRRATSWRNTSPA